MHATCDTVNLAATSAPSSAAATSTSFRSCLSSRARHNQYATSIHATNSLVLKTSKLSVATPVYRGMANAALPKEFFEPNEDGVSGGVEYGFSSTTTDRAVAEFYSKHGLDVTILHKPSSSESPNCIDYLSEGKIDLVIDCPNSMDSQNVTDGYEIRRSAVDSGTALVTNIKQAMLILAPVPSQE